MTAKEYRDKEAITDANFWNGNEIDFDAICEFADDYHEAKLKLLNIAVVMDCKHLECIECGKVLKGLDHHDGKCFDCINSNAT